MSGDSKTQTKAHDRSSSSSLSRRRFLGTTALTSAGLMAGCLGGDGGDRSGDQGSDGGDQGDGGTTPGSDGSNEGAAEYTFSTGPTDSVAFGMANSLAAVIRDNSDHVMNVKASTSSQSVALLARGETDLAYATTLVGLNAMNREGVFANVDFERTLLQLPSYYWIRVGLVAKASSDIEYYGDLAGKPVGPGPSGASYWAPMELALFKVMSESELDLKNGGVSRLADTLSSGRAVAVGGPLYTNGVVGSFMKQVYSQEQVRLLGWRDDAIQKIEDDPKVPGLFVPNEKLGNIAEFTMEDETFMVSANYVMYASEEMPEDTIYELYKTAWDNRQALTQAHAAFQPWTQPEFYAANMTPEMPVHPGAAKFLKEVGAWSDEFQVGDI